MHLYPKQYNFVDALTDIRSVIHLIGLHGSNLIGLEVGVFRAESHCTILQNCPNVKKLYGIDNWKPYTDYLNPNDSNLPDKWQQVPINSTNESEMELVEFTAKHNIKWSGESNRSELWKGNSEDLVQRCDDGTFDFIFLDAWLNYDQVLQELYDWYPKVKTGGLFIGHDYHCEVVRRAVEVFREDEDINKHMSTYDGTFVWRK